MTHAEGKVSLPTFGQLHSTYDVAHSPLRFQGPENTQWGILKTKCSRPRCAIPSRSGRARRRTSTGIRNRPSLSRDQHDVLLTPLLIRPSAGFPMARYLHVSIALTDMSRKAVDRRPLLSGTRRYQERLRNIHTMSCCLKWKSLLGY